MAKKKMHKHSTILDIADKVGLSHMTVSRVLSGKTGVREATRQRVLKAAEKLNYSPNSLANGFRSGKTQSAGIVWQFVDPWAGDTAVGLWVMQALQRHGLATYQSQFSPDLAEMTAVLDDLLRRRVDAIVIGGTPEVLSHPDILRRIEKVPAVVAVSYAPVEGFKGDQVIHDRNAAIRQVVRHLAITGKRRPAMLLSMEVEANHDKLRTFRAAMAENGIPDHPRTLVEMGLGDTPMTLSQPFNSDADRYTSALMQAWPAGTPIDVDAIFSFNDLGAMVTAKFLRDRGVNIGRDVAVIGFNNDPATSLFDPPLATGDRSRAALAETTQDMVLSRLKNQDLPPRIKRVEMSFVWRESAGGSGPGVA
jgi:LacI family transcriptional regulator